MLRPCRVCGIPSKQALCEKHRIAKQQARQSRQARGYDTEYDRNARALKRAAGRAGAREGAQAGAGTHARGSENESQSQLGMSLSLNSTCVICGLPILPAEAFTIEHIRPLRAGGTSELSNLGPAHARCNYGWRRKRR